MALRVIATLLYLLLTCYAASAQDAVKRSVFEDCDLARSEFGKLTVEQQSSLLDFLARVIALNTQSPSAPEAYAVAPGTQLPGDPKGLTAPRGSDLIPGTLWQSMDAKRELRAKRCVLDLLESAGALSFPIISSLVSTYSEQPLSDEIAVSVEEVTASIAEVAHLQGHSLEVKSIEAIVPHALGQRPLVARNIIHEFRQEALPYLVSLIATKGETPKPDMLQFLKTLDPDGSQVFRAAINLIPGLSVEQTRHLITALPLPSLAALPMFVKDLIQLAADPTQSQTFTPLLGRTCLALGGMTIDQVQQDTIGTIQHVLTRGTVSAEEAGCLVQSSASLARKLVVLLSSSDAEQQRYAIELAQQALGRSPGEIRSEAYATLRRIALDLHAPLWREAVGALAAFPERKGDTISLAQQLTKAPAKTAIPSKEFPPLEPIFELLNALSIGKDTGRFSGLIIQSLRAANPVPAAVLLAKHAPSLDPSILTLALVSPPTKSSLAALDVLTSRGDIPQKAVPQLIELLKYPEASPLAERGLISLGKPVIAPLRKATLRLSSGAPRMAAIGVLASIGATTKVEMHSATASLASLDDCSFVATRGGLVCTLSKQRDTDTETKQLLTSVIHRCLPTISPETLQLLISCNPDALISAAEPVGAMLSADSGAATRLEPLVEFAIQQVHTRPDEFGPLVAQLLNKGQKELRERVLASLPVVPGIPPEVQDVLIQLSTDAALKSESKKVILRALASAGNTQYPWREFVKKSIEAAYTSGLDSDTAGIIAVIPIDAVLSEVLPALESGNSEQLVGAALVGAALGPKAIPLVSRLWHLRTMRSPAVRYTASLALLEINPLTPDLHDTVKRVLVNRFFETAATIPIRWADTVAVNDLEKGSFGTLRRERLARLLSPPGHQR